MSPITRRSFLARTAAAGTAVAVSSFRNGQANAADPLIEGMPNTRKIGWRVGFSAYTFRNVTTFESLEKMAKTGLRYAELFSWQNLSPENPDAKPNPDLSKTLRHELKSRASDCGVELVGCYTGLSNPDAAKAFFDFAANMGFQFIVSEPPESVLDAIEKLSEEYGIDLALHNHPKPSHYWNPETGLAALKGRSKRMGFCCDTGHWVRCGLDPVEMLKKVAPRVKTFHLKDLEKFGVRGAKDVVWGQGHGRIADILAEVNELGIENPYFGIEWERNVNEPLETHAASAAFFEKVASRLVGQ